MESDQDPRKNIRTGNVWGFLKLYCVQVYWPFCREEEGNAGSSIPNQKKTSKILKLKVCLNKEQFHISGFRIILLDSGYWLLFSFIKILYCIEGPNHFLTWLRRLLRVWQAQESIKAKTLYMQNKTKEKGELPARI